MSLAAITDKRIKYELKNLKKARMENIQVIQDENDKFTFYFLLKGISKSDYDGGYYMGKIILPPDYPNSPVDYKMLTPSGRFQINSSICLTNSKYHKDQWTPAWNLENMTVGFISIFNDDTEHGISHIKDTSQNRKMFASQSVDYNLTHYKSIFICFDQFVNSDGSIKTDEELNNEHNEFIADKKKKKNTADKPHKTITVVLENNDTNYDKNINSFEAILGKNHEDKHEVEHEDKHEVKHDEKLEQEPHELSRSEMAKCKLDLIKQMSFENFDLGVYNDAYFLLTSSYSLAEL